MKRTIDTIEKVISQLLIELALIKQDLSDDSFERVAPNAKDFDVSEEG